MNLSLISQYIGFKNKNKNIFINEENSRIYTHSATHSQMELSYFIHKCGISTSSVHSFHTIVSLGHALKRLCSKAHLSRYITPLRQGQTSLLSFLSLLLSISKSFYQLKAGLKYKNKLVFILLNSYASLGTSILI